MRLILFFGLALGAQASRQSMIVSGILSCRSAKVGDKAWIQLLDKDTIGSDDMMAKQEVQFNKYGRVMFTLEGSASDVSGDIDPYVKVYHNCAGTKTTTNADCPRSFKVDVDKKYIEKGEKPFRIYDMGVINLGTKHKGEKRECMN